MLDRVWLVGSLFGLFSCRLDSGSDRSVLNDIVNNVEQGCELEQFVHILEYDLDVIEAIPAFVLNL